MKILFDLCPAQMSASGGFDGGGEYCRSVFFKLCETETSIVMDVVYHAKYGMDEDVLNVIRKKNIKVNLIKDIGGLENLVNRYDRFYTALPYRYYNLKLRNSVHFVYTVHGLRDMEKPYDKYYLPYEHYRVKAVVKTIIHKACPVFFYRRAKKRMQKLFDITDNRKIIVVSEHTKYAVLSNFTDIRSDEIEVFYAPEKRTDGQVDEEGLSDCRYMLMVSGNRWLKNNLRASIALDQLISANRIDDKVIITGVKNKKVYTQFLKNRDHFLFMDYVSVAKLEGLYKNAGLFIFPSLNEGFGYPPLEAMKYGTAVICAADTSITEVCGDAVLYFNPVDIMEMKTRILEAVDTDKKRELSQKAVKQYEKIKTIQNRSLDKMIREIVGS